MIALFLISLACRQPHSRRMPAAWEILSGLLIRTGIVDQTPTIESAGVVFRPYENGGGRVFAQTFGAKHDATTVEGTLSMLSGFWKR